MNEVVTAFLDAKGGSVRKQRTPSIGMTQIASRITMTRSGCWIWTGALNVRGQPRYAGRRAVPLIWHLYHDEPPKRYIYPKCGNILCVSPHHLVAGSMTERKRALGLDLGGRPQKEYCARGHRLEGENVGHNSDGYRFCRKCRRINARNRHREQQRGVA